jgi:hypothetical protein
LKED